MIINKRYKDIFRQYIHKNEPTPLTIGTLVVCALCFLILIVATFTQLNISHPWFNYNENTGFVYNTKNIAYNPLIPAMVFIIYILGIKYSLLLFILYLLVGFFIWPIFGFGGGLGYVQNYLFGYFLGFGAAIVISGTIFKLNQKLKMKLLSAVLGVIAIHLFGLFYCLILAIFRVIDFNLFIPILNIVFAGRIIYDIIASIIVILIAPYIKNILWVCMKPKPDKPKKLKNSGKRNKVVSDNVDESGQYYN